MQLYDQIQETVKYIQSKTDFKPDFGLVLGTGLSKLSQEIEITAIFDYKDLPNFPATTVKGHAGKLILGHLAGRKIVAMSGRFHYYEGYSMQEVTFPIRVLKYLGIRHLFLSNAAGSINEHINAGDIVFIQDHINLHTANPLRGENDERLGPRFPDMLNTYDRRLNAKALGLARELRIRAHEGVYIGLQGPNLETPAEYKFLNIIGGDVVGMSTIPEVLVARHMSLPVFVLSVVSNKCYPIEILTSTTLEEVLEVVEKAEPNARLIVKGLLEELV